MRSRRALAILAAVLAPLTFTPAHAQQDKLHITVDADYPVGDPVNEATVFVTNLTPDKVIILETVEFEGQLPAGRNFYHVISDLPQKFNDCDGLMIDLQCTSGPYAFAVLLPNQTYQWKRPYRFGYRSHAIVKYREIPLSDAPAYIFPSSIDFAPLTPDRHGMFLAIAASSHWNIYTEVKGFKDLQSFEAKQDVVEIFCDTDWYSKQRDAEIKASCGLVDSAKIIDNGDGEAFVYEDTRAYPLSIDYETKQCTRGRCIDPLVADFILSKSWKSEKIPTIVSSKRFGDLITLAEPREERGFQPPINQLDAKQLKQLLRRAEELEIEPVVKLIVPNFADQRLVLCIGQVDARGNRIE